MKRVDVLDLSDEQQALVAETEVSGTQTVFERNGRAVAILASYDEYLAMRETIAIANDSLLYARLEEADEQMRKSRVLTGPVAQTLQGENERLRFPRVVENDWKALNPSEQDVVRRATAVIDEDPIAGAPLFEPLKGLWSYRTGELRIVYRIVTAAKYVVVLSITKT